MIPYLSDFIAIGVVWWVVVLAEFAFLFYAVFFGWNTRAFASIVIAMFLLYGTSPLVYMSNNPIGSFVGVVVYVILGIVFMFGRWEWTGITYTQKHAEATGSEKKRLADNWPTARAYKTRLISWMAYWPVSGVIFVVTELAHDFFTQIYHHFSGILDTRMEARRKRAVPAET